MAPGTLLILAESLTRFKMPPGTGRPPGGPGQQGVFCGALASFHYFRHQNVRRPLSSKTRDPPLKIKSLIFPTLPGDEMFAAGNAKFG
jgi:hypothetical protein